MRENIVDVSNRIMTILDLFPRPLYIKELQILIGEPYYLVNFSLAQLFKKDQITIKSKDGSYLIRKKDSSLNRIRKMISQV